MYVVKMWGVIMNHRGVFFLVGLVTHLSTKEEEIWLFLTQWDSAQYYKSVTFFSTSSVTFRSFQNMSVWAGQISMHTFPPLTHTFTVLLPRARKPEFLYLNLFAPLLIRSLLSRKIHSVKKEGEERKPVDRYWISLFLFHCSFFHCVDENVLDIKGPITTFRTRCNIRSL